MADTTNHQEKPPRPSSRRRIVALAAVALLVLGVAVVLRFALPDRATRLRQMDVRALQAAARARPNDAEVFLLLGKRLRQLGDRHGGFVITNRAYDLSSGEPRFLAAMAGALMDEADYDSAYRLLNDGKTRWPDAGEIHAEYARFYAERGHFADALREAETAVRAAPQFAEGWQALGKARAENKRPDEAYSAFERALALEPRDAELLADYGDALARYGRPDQAEALLRRAVSFAPRAARPAARLGRLLADRARSAPERAAARTLLERALAQAPRATEVRYTLGLLALRDGDYPRAVTLFKECTVQDPAYGEAHEALGQAYLKMGRPDAAHAAFEQWRRFSDFRRETAHLEMRLRREPANRDLLRRMVQLYLSHGAKEQAEPYQRRLRGVESPAGPAVGGSAP
jgi:Flp pilus assembly protein TadD